MAEKVTYEDKPLDYCKQILTESATRNDTLSPINEENRLLYEGVDTVLEERKNDPEVQRNAININILKPAVDTRVADPITKLSEHELPVRVKAKMHNPTDAVKEQVEWVERQLNQQLVECGYLPGGFQEHITAAEIYRTPSAVKVSWEEEVEETPEVEEVPDNKTIEAAAAPLGALPTKQVVRWKSVVRGRPTAQWLFTDEFLYQPYTSNFQRDSQYAIHRSWLTEDEVLAQMKALKWDEKKTKRALKDAVTQSENSSSTEADSPREKIEQEKDTPYDEGYRDGRFLVCENYIVQYDERGRRYIEVATTVGNREIVHTRKNFKGLGFPFALATSHNLPGTIEQMSTVDIGKPFQKLYSEVCNCYLDGANYGMFPPLLAPIGTQFKGKPKWGLAQIWYHNRASNDDIRPLIESPGKLPDLPGLMEGIHSKFREAVNAMDLNQGFQSMPYEKATSTKIRFQASQQRSNPTNKRYGLVLREVAEMFLVLNQQFHDERSKFVVPEGVSIDVPALTNTTDPSAEKQDLVMLATMASQNPLYMAPNGQRKLRNLWERIFRVFKQENVEELLPTEQELELQIKDQTDLAIKQQQLAALANDAQMGQQSQQMMQPPNKPQGAQ